LKGVEELVKAHHIRAEVVAHVRVEAPHDTVRLDTELPTTEEAQVQRSLASGSPAVWPIRVTTPSRDTLTFTRPFPKVWRVIVLLQRRGRERKLPYGIGCDFCTLIPAN